MRNSIAGPRRRHHQSTKQKAAKPWPGFPLTAHPSGRWCKKVKGKIVYFGRVGDRQAALDAEAKWNEQRDDLMAGRVPRSRMPVGKVLEDLVNSFLTAKKSLVPMELSPTTFTAYHHTCAKLVEHFGRDRRLDDLRPDDFSAYRVKLAARLCLVTLGNEIQRTRTVFRHAEESEMIAAPIKFGPAFKRPRKQAIDLDRSKRSPRLYTPEQIHQLLGVASEQMKAMILLGCNGGMGNSDLANLPLGAVDLERGWVNYPRPKTGMKRRFPLWPETVEALRNVIARRVEPKKPADANLLFVTRCGGRWCKAVLEERTSSEKGGVSKHVMYNDDAIGKEFVKLFAAANVVRKARCSFYTLRHCFETVAGDSRDQVATDFIMGHKDLSMAEAYREEILDHRLQAVVDHVHKWLFGISMSS